MTKAIIFARVSSNRQDYTRQIADLKPLIKSDGYSDDEIAIIQHKESATQNDIQSRKSVQELKDLIKENPIESVYVTEVSRLSRRNDVMYAILKILEERKIALVIQTPSLIRTYYKKDGQWLRDSFSHIVIQFLEQASINESEVKLERQRSGLKRKKELGHITTSRVKFGYRRSADNKPEIDEENADIVRHIFNMYINGTSSGSIWDYYKHSGVFASMTQHSGENHIGKMLRDKTYIGQNKHYPYPAIITEELFYKVKEKLSSNHLVKTRTKCVYYAQGLLKVDGHTMTPAHYKIQYVYENKELHKGWYLNINYVDSLLWNLTCEALSTMSQSTTKARLEEASRSLEMAQKKLVGIEKDIKNNEQEQERVDYMFQKGKYSQEKYDFESDRIDGEKLYLLKEKENYQKTVVELETLLSTGENKHMEGVKTYYNLIDITDDSERQRLIRQAIESVNVKRVDNGYELRVDYVDKTLNTPTYYLYTNKAPNCKLYCCYDGVMEDWTSGVVNRIARPKRKKKES